MNKLHVAALLLAIIILGVFIRAIPLLEHFQFYEPDIYYYYSIMQTSLLVHHISFVGLSGFPTKNLYTESPILLYEGLALSWLGLVNSMHLAVLISDVISFILLFLLVRELTGNDKIALLAVFFLAISIASFSKTVLTEFRGDTFISTYALAALYCALLLSKAKEHQYALTILLGAVLGLGAASWKGGAFIFPIFLLIAFIEALRKNKNVYYLLAAIFLAWAFWHITILIDGETATVLPLFRYGFIVIFIGTLIPCLLVLNFKIDKKLALIIMSIITAIIMIIILYPFHFKQIIKEKLLSTGVFPFAAIAETQGFSFAVFLTSFGYALLFAILGLIAVFLKKYRYVLFILPYFLITFILQLLQRRWLIILAPPMAILAALGVYFIVDAIKPRLIRAFLIALIILMLGVQLYVAFYIATYSTSADNLNPQFMQAMSWISHNTSKNATFLTLWDDGSVIEGAGNRTSKTDSVAGATTPDILGFDNWLVSNSPPTYIIATKPDYLVVRKYWLQEYNGILFDSSYYNFSNQTFYSNTIDFNMTNLDKLEYCSWGSFANAITATSCNFTGVKLQEVYLNNDTIIDKVDYS
jgi:asparagine N-glycosylation enzyme membrane subunit Stt3